MKLHHAFRGLVVLAVAVLASSTLTAAGGCLSAELPETAILPDHSLHEQGTLMICVDRELSPTGTILKTYIDGSPVGMSLGRNAGAATPEAADQPFFGFRRNDNGELRLQMLAFRDSRGELRLMDIRSLGRRQPRVTTRQQQFVMNDSTLLTVLAD